MLSVNKFPNPEHSSLRGENAMMPLMESKHGKMQKQTILHINASLTHNSVTDRVAAKMIDHLTHHYHRHICGNNDFVTEVENPENVLNIEECDVWSTNMPKFDRETMSRVWKARHGSENVADLEAFRPIKELAEQMLRADFLVITSPVWNFSVPYALKQYIDCVVQAGLTFHDKDDEGPSRPYFRGKPLIVISSSGGKAPPAHEDYVFPFLSRIFAMCGFDDAHRVAIEDLATHDKDECFRNAVREANCIADNVVQNHKLRLDMNDE